MASTQDKGGLGEVRRPARIRDVAARAGVSPGLVSRLLNNDPTLTVRPETRAQVMDAVRELDYVASSAAASLRRNRADALGLVLDRVTNPVFADVVHGAEEAATEIGCGLLILDAEEIARDTAFLTEVVKSRRVDGLLLQGGYGPDAGLLARYSAEIPSVIVNSPGNDVASGVSLEDEAATRLATSHLIELGHRDVAFVAGAPGAASDTRLRGFRAALRDAGLEARPDRILGGGWQAEDGLQAVRASDPSTSPVTAYVAASSVVALGVVSALAEAQVRVPEDVSVVGIHDPWFAPYLAPALTTVALPLFELGRQSVLQLMEHLQSGKPSETVITDPAPRLVVRGSTRPPRSFRA
ncbi:LacI family DNA-binding transcriptional regulator [Cellulomonas chengniuliangii]|uniref:LacI family transcriptional regulator n=1 Tax=Cellulomonas chengniuliangii TaxID=2968084 RepID=A0ABY5L515_9CELL|nr:LacI family DNA-binding transcriptional regulator [Cellulomonas chengniuliangii]MCC2308303.1 LacI family transcriptional regulator [Cellulomonas chengniuliangii]UUI76687.1 LacI family transcriptional regulator [Cellulomonas chengniuliangii]